MKVFDISTHFASNTQYRFKGKVLAVDLDNTTRPEGKIYGSTLILP